MWHLRKSWEEQKSGHELASIQDLLCYAAKPPQYNQDTHTLMHMLVLCCCFCKAVCRVSAVKPDLGCKAILKLYFTVKLILWTGFMKLTGVCSAKLSLCCKTLLFLWSFFGQLWCKATCMCHEAQCLLQISFMLWICSPPHSNFIGSTEGLQRLLEGRVNSVDISNVRFILPSR